MCTHSVFMDDIMKNTRDLKVVNSLSLNCKTSLEKLFCSYLDSSNHFCSNHLDSFYDLMHNGFWGIPKITFANLSKPIRNIIIPFSSDTFSQENVERKGKIPKSQYMESEKSFN